MSGCRGLQDGLKAGFVELKVSFNKRKYHSHFECSFLRRWYDGLGIAGSFVRNGCKFSPRARESQKGGKRSLGLNRNMATGVIRSRTWWKRPHREQVFPSQRYVGLTSGGKSDFQRRIEGLTACALTGPGMWAV